MQSISLYDINLFHIYERICTIYTMFNLIMANNLTEHFISHHYRTLLYVYMCKYKMIESIIHILYIYMYIVFVLFIICLTYIETRSTTTEQFIRPIVKLTGMNSYIFQYFHNRSNVVA